MKSSAAIFISLSMLSSGVLAQDGSQAGASSETGTLINRRPASVHGTSKRDARNTTRQFGQCVVQRSPVASLKLVNAAYGGPEYQNLIKNVYAEECLGGGELTMPQKLARSAVFEGLYLERFGRNGPVDFSKSAPIDYAAAYTSPVHEAAGEIVALGRFGDCVARADGVNAKAFILSMPETSAEGQAIAALKPKLGPCVPNGLKITFSRSVLRGAIAEGLYRLSVAPMTVNQ